MQTVQVSQDGGLQLQQQQQQVQSQSQHQHQNHHHHQPQQQQHHHHQNRRLEEPHHNSRGPETGAGVGSGTAEHDSDDGNVLLSADENDEEDHESPGAMRNGKRKRPISVSCETCKQRKVKCDRGQPSCGWCRRNSVSCEYRERKKPGLRAGYGRELEQRLDRLEEILRSHSEILNTTFMGSSPTHHGIPPPSVRNSNPSIPSDHGTPREPTALFRPNEPLRTPQAETALFIQKPISFSTAQGPDFGIPPTTSSMHPVNDGFSAQMQPAGISPPGHLSTTLQASTATQDYYGQPHQQALPSPGLSVAQSQTQISSDQELPPYDLLYALADLYFKHINTWCPILHRKTTLDSLFGPSTLDEADRVLLHAIVATTLRFSTDARLTDERRRHYHDVSKQRVLLSGRREQFALRLAPLRLDLYAPGHGAPRT
ncbi:hypothetical protein NPX13_g10554 [Xylaria arbuscula]|uniref:Zn(2)-C6 fungal-type domain-containing protein n=1 Tax=Xylaria arbuscula TaxID=114810 RepID=A0A9W8N4J5_9PEZI|nr:hypothetical protein NPX13_g10554 [Xylaria arbuscula]